MAAEGGGSGGADAGAVAEAGGGVVEAQAAEVPDIPIDTRLSGLLLRRA